MEGLDKFFRDYVTLYGLLIGTGGLVVVAILLALTWWRRSTALATIAFLASVIVGLFLQPWFAFTPSASNNPADAYGLAPWRAECVGSMLLFIATVVRWFSIRSAQTQTAQFRKEK